mgnify:CR=1 FL=1
MVPSTLSSRSLSRLRTIEDELSPEIMATLSKIKFFQTVYDENWPQTEFAKFSATKETLVQFLKAREELLRSIGQNPALVVCGETGCGKSTQVPQFVLDAAIDEHYVREVRVEGDALVEEHDVLLELTLNGQQFSSSAREYTFYPPSHVSAVSPTSGPVAGQTWEDKTPQQAFDILSKPDITVTNQSDKDVQLPKLLQLDAFARQVVAEDEANRA